jgi:hypothetical protein
LFCFLFFFATGKCLRVCTMVAGASWSRVMVSGSTPLVI